ncbi:MAG: RNA polymerase sigma factor [Acidimicrobiales bacterium]
MTVTGGGTVRHGAAADGAAAGTADEGAPADHRHLDGVVGHLDGVVDLARDRDLVEQCQRGDETAFTELYDRYHRRLLRFCLRRLHEPNDAEEAVQEAFTRAWRAMPRFGGERRFYPWLSVIAANVCTDILRRRSRFVPMDDLPLAVGASDEDEVDAALLRQVDLAMATEALAHLSERHQRVLRLRETSGWSTQRIAEQEGVAAPAVDTLLWRARQALKREFVALAENGGRLAVAAGFSLVALRRLALRHAARMASQLPLHSLPPVRGSGMLVATAAVTGAAIAGGSIALVGAGHAPAPGLPAAVSSIGTRPSGAAPGRTADARAPAPGAVTGGGGTGALPHGAAATGGAVATSEAGPVATGNGIAPTVAGASGGAAGPAGSGTGLDGVVRGSGGGVSAVGGAVSGAGSAVGGAVSGLTGGLDPNGSTTTTTTSTTPVGTAGATINGLGTVVQGVTSSAARGRTLTGTASGSGPAPSTPLSGLAGILGG